MASRAGIALSRLAYDAQFTLTRVDGAPGPAVFSSPQTPHTLSEAQTIKDMTNAFERVIDFDVTERDNGYTITYPLAANKDQRDGFNKAKLYSHDHFHAWANGVGYGGWNDGKEKWNVYFLFVDVTPGQVAAKCVYGNTSKRGWTYNFGDKSAILSEEEQAGVESWTAQDVYDKLVQPLLPPNNKKLSLVGILRPEGTLPNLDASELESKLNGVPLRWVQLNDLSYGAAVIMNCQAIYDSDIDYGPSDTPLPTGITLANGKTMTIITAHTYCPSGTKLIFTTSEDNQPSATVKILRGTTPFEQLTLNGLTPKPKGEARIKVSFELTEHGHARCTIGEVGTDKRAYQNFGSILIWNKAEVDAYKKETTNKQIDKVVGEDGVVGELPA
ncbi:hypothetical protein CPB86DRAFT_791214 [Serendipita vermifera]|nr:hypothetical protein CPB86DRAFT_791214 [Serendipita vermifera]